MTTAETIVMYKDNVEDLKLILVDAKATLKEAMLLQAFELHGIEIGSIVIYKTDEYRVTAIDTTWSQPWARGVKKKKDGKFGIQERHLYSDWSLKVKPVDIGGE